MGLLRIHCFQGKIKDSYLTESVDEILVHKWEVEVRLFRLGN
jgi:hypothetical protein